MSLKNKIKEIKRLVVAFEKEASNFPALKFRTILLNPEQPFDNEKFDSPNHIIMLWQYYGELGSELSTDGFLNNLKDSNLKWGIRGAQLSYYAVIEGKLCDHFSRMVKRAGNIFNKEEAHIIQTRVVSEIQEEEKDGLLKPTAIVNDNAMAIWLNYLLYYISMVHPGREKSKNIEPDPFSLSLLALEQLLEEHTIKKVDKSLTKVEDIKFKVALSFAGEKRGFVSSVADVLRNELENDQLFYDYDFQSQLAKPDLDLTLQNIYRNNSDLIVVFLCKEYTKKQWCGLEWRAIRDIIKTKENNKVMFIRFDDTDVDGVFSIDGYIDANQFSSTEIAKFILERVLFLDV